MGKDLKGKELGVGICQRKDGLYTARFVSKRTGKSVQKYFPKLQECRKWYADAKFEDEHGGINASGDMTVTAWFDYWIENIKGDSIRPNTIRNYKERFEHNIQTRITLYCMFSDAVENDVIYKNPVTKGIKHNIGKEPKKVRALTIDEQKKFLEVAEKSSNYNQFAFILQTGLRTGELIGLKWSDIDWEKRAIHIQRSMEYRYSVGEWRIGEPKSKSGYRDVPLIEEAVAILKRQKEKLREIKVINMQFKEHVFLCRKGEPTKNSAYDTSLFKLCDKAGIRRFSMHVLRHTMATRCIEGGMRPKTLQVILGHANVGITMNLYVDVTEEEKFKEVEKIESALKIV
ncbi:site-specific integrase [bacterium D16-51]|nr:site-specific integrase [bacterium D16-59]RKI59803.1 site-specific integrase [bacterium D16-51]